MIMQVLESKPYEERLKESRYVWVGEKKIKERLDSSFLYGSLPNI